jgi:hypothetical protein
MHLVHTALLHGCSPSDYGTNYQMHLLEQYKLMVEMADRVSARRMQANTFFLAANTGLLTVFASLAKDKILSGVLGALPIGALLILCVVWERIMGSYRQLNNGKFEVINYLEQLLPTAPYAAEWVAIGAGMDPSRYRPLSLVEIWVPRLFGLLYGLLLVAVLFSRSQSAGAVCS